MIEIEIPGRKRYRLQHLALDVNGTIACDGRVIEGVSERLRLLSHQLEIHLLTADTHGKQNEIDLKLGIKAHRIPAGSEIEEKAHYMNRLNVESVVAFGNGSNDMAMLDRAVLSVAILGYEGLSVETLRKADVVVKDINDALDLLLYPNRLVATLRQ